MGVFDQLSPASVLAAVEAFTDRRFEPTVEPYLSYVNRVYGLRDVDGRGWVAKFYRPGRWSEEALVEEHEFLFDCAADEVPVALPVADADGQTLGELVLGPGAGASVFFAVFEKRGGRPFDAEGGEAWRRLGQLVGRLHATGRRRRFDHRPTLGPLTTFLPQVQTLLDADLLPPGLASRFEALLVPAARHIDRLFPAADRQRIHGDLHRGNLLDRPGEGLLVLDFDDCAWGPPLQDLWLLLPDRLPEAPGPVAGLLSGYSEFLDPPPVTAPRIEGLRLMRMVHHLAWTALQRRDRGFLERFPEWDEPGYWRRELADLEDQVEFVFLD